MNTTDFNNLVTPVLSCKFGASMGRSNVNKLDKFEVNGRTFYKTIKTTTRRIYLSNGYDKGGAYWGIGSPLYAKYSKCGRFIEYFRAPKN